MVRSIHLLYFLIIVVSSDDVSEILKEYGYPYEIHSVRTSDGYILGVHRIPFSNFDKTNKNTKEVVLLMHGFLSSSADWVVVGREISLAFKLADAGYDVWMGNARGNTYSRNHISLKPKSDEFWDFSLDEIGKFDVPALIDYILNVTSQSSLFYIGYSQGGTVLMILLSTLPKYNSKIRTAILLAPVAFMSNIPCPICRDVLFKPTISIFKEFLNVNEIIPKTDFQFLRTHCRPDDETFVVYRACQLAIRLIAGPGENTNLKLLPKISKTFPAGASAKQFIHFYQLIKSGKFQSFDFGVDNNKKYGRLPPPEYNFSNIVVPFALFYGTNDYILAVEDAEKVAKKLKNVIGKFKIEGWNHFDFMYGAESYRMINSRVLKVLKSVGGL